jgi:hypothetical protein
MSIEWVVGIAVTVLMALFGALWAINQYEIRALRKSLHDLRDNLPTIIVRWAEFVMKRGPNGNHKQ